MIVAMTIVVQAATPLSTFQDQFTDLSNWITFGTPAPELIPTQFGRTGVLDNNGDGTERSGAITVQSFTGTGGFTLTADVYLDFSDTSLCGAEAAIGIANPTLQAWSGYDPYIQLSIQGVGRACAILSDSLRGHAYFFGSFVTASGTESFFPTEASPALFRADQYVGAWHTLKITTDGAGQPRFYVDDILIYTGANAVSSAVLTGLNPLWVGSQSSGDAGKAYHDNLSFTNVCAWPAAISLAAPANAATLCNTLVAFSWATDGAASEYQIQVDNSSGLVSPEIDLQISAPTTTVAVTIGDDCLPRYWRVRAINSCGVGAWSTARSFTVCTTLPAPTLVSPADGAVAQTQPVEIDWDAVDGATGYAIQVDDDANFGSPAVDVAVTATDYSVSELIGSTDYYWRVRSNNSCGHSSWSSTRDFTTDACPLPDDAVLQSPADQDSLLAQPVVLDWSDAAVATSYRVQLDDDSSFSTPVYDQEVIVSTASVSGLPAGALRYWRIRSRNACGWADWSEKRRFSTCAPIAAPTPIVPADHGVIEQRPVFFHWDTVADADSYLVEIDVNAGFNSPSLVSRKAGAGITQFGSYDLAFSTRYYWRVCAYSDCGWGLFSAMRTCSTGTGLAVEDLEDDALPSQYALMQNYPNPFNAETTIEFSLPQASRVRLEILNILGQHIAAVVDETLSAGRKRTSWDGRDSAGRSVPSGIYFYRITAGDFAVTRRLVLLK